MKAIQPGPWTQFPWHSLGNFKYLMYIPLLLFEVYTRYTGAADPNNVLAFVLALTAARHFIGQLCITLSRWPYLVRNREIQKKGFSFDSVDHSSNWDDHLIMTAFFTTALYMTPWFRNQRYPMWDLKGLVICLLFHMGPTEAIYYWLHRALHNHYLYTRYHSHHHSLFITEANSGTVHPYLLIIMTVLATCTLHSILVLMSFAGTVHPFAEHVMYLLNFTIPIVGTWALGRLSLVTIGVYLICFDFLNAVGHCNFEFVPEWLFRAFPPLKYLIYTPSYHSLHHSHVHTNFCLFMPMYDYWGGTLDKSSDALYHSVSKGVKQNADFVYLMHGMDLLHIFHVTLGIQSFAAMPYTPHWLLWPLYPVAVLVMLLLWLCGQPFAVDKYQIPGVRGETWVIPRYRFQYSLSMEKNRINALIEKAIVSADAEGSKVISLGMLNKEASLNGGGTLQVQKNPRLRIRVVSGYTLTAAVIIKRLPKHVQEVFLVGSSEISRGIALYLAKQGVRVLMLTRSQQSFESIQSELPRDSRRFLVNVTKFQAGKQCPEWILEESIEAKDQQWAPAGAHFHQFDLHKPLPKSRKDCTYGTYPAMQVPNNIKGLRSCEVSLPRGVVHACHAAGLVHQLEEWKHHEVGPINIERIDSVWEAALKHGFEFV